MIQTLAQPVELRKKLDHLLQVWYEIFISFLSQLGWIRSLSISKFILVSQEGTISSLLARPGRGGLGNEKWVLPPPPIVEFQTRSKVGSWGCSIPTPPPKMTQTEGFSDPKESRLHHPLSFEFKMVQADPTYRLAVFLCMPIWFDRTGPRFKGWSNSPACLKIFHGSGVILVPDVYNT